MNFTVLVLLNSILLLSFTIQGFAKCENKTLSWHWFDFEQCGPVRKNGRITGGTVAPLGQFPWMARLGYEQGSLKIKFNCGGSIINTKYILTAAHCINGFEKQLKVVRLGENYGNASKDCYKEACAPPVQDIYIKKMHMHPGYDHKTVQHDIALIRLEHEITYNEFVKPICLPRDELLKKKYVTQYVEIAGWGIMDSSTEQESDLLLYVSLPVRDLCACKIAMPDMTFNEMQFCVGLENGMDSCTGDSGGPMMKKETILGTKRYHLIGVVSIGKSYCGEGPAAYTNVIKYIDWILETIGKHEEDCEENPNKPQVDNWAPPENLRI